VMNGIWSSLCNVKFETCPPATINNIQILVQTEVKYLGLYLDQKLTWQKHIKTKRQQLNLKIRQMSWLLGLLAYAYLTWIIIHWFISNEPQRNSTTTENNVNCFATRNFSVTSRADTKLTGPIKCLRYQLPFIMIYINSGVIPYPYWNSSSCE
jgi:hypothetical protein